jgi:DNA repair photolyase
VILRRVSNPPNPYLTECRQWLEEPPVAALEVYEETARTILTENDSPDIPFRYSVNPYRGCQHACAYCYARPYHQYLDMGAGTDFDTRLVAKVNAPDLLRDAFSRRHWTGEWICFSGITDCYQPLEASYGLTRGCLQACLEHRNPATIVTKGFLVVRDAGLIADLHRAAGAAVYISIPFADDALARLIEPQAPPPSRRLEAVRRLAGAGVPVGVMVAPMIPGLNDRDIPAILMRAAQAGARSASYVALRLPGSVAPVFLERLRAAVPLRAARVEARIREMRGGAMNDSRFGRRMRGQGTYWKNIESLFHLSLRRYGLAAVPRRSPTVEDNLRIAPEVKLRGSRPGQLLLDFGAAQAAVEDGTGGPLAPEP